ncbi:Protein NifZ [uncultured Alphaproteobacteria bacterium]|uniref:Protein NifZ n=1 Tax=uncultured Alphaproteobacteria bacterium TaxID=91750 RepID=A0A212K4P7_9PROT|nr:Protein NifZ [uncultured Alphaproteobacteria bacterium]
MDARYDFGEAVRVVRNIRNDGTYPGRATGELLVRRGRVGYVRDVGVFLQDQVVYSVHFLEIGRVVGCREQELISAADPWIDSAFDHRDRVAATRALAVAGEVRVEPGEVGEVLRVLRDAETGVIYHVAFAAGMFAVPEAALSAHALKEDGE